MTISATLQENLFTLVVFNPQYSSLIRNSAPKELFSSSVYREMVGRVYDYIDQFRVPPGDHLPELFSDILEKKDHTAELCSSVLDTVYALRPTVNPQYVVSQLETFIRQQSLKTAVVSASDAIQAGDLDGAEEALNAGMQQRLKLFSPGLRLTEGVHRLDEIARPDCLKLGIKELDDWALGPARGELWLFIGPPKRAKTWAMVHVGKQALLRRHNVCYVTLEISEEQVAQRFIQSLFSVQRTQARVNVVRIKTDDLGRMLKLERDVMRNRLSLKDHTTRKHLATELAKFHARDNLMIKSFPTGALTIPALRAYLDSLERTAHFIPAFLIVDYPDLMKTDPRNHRLELGAIFKELRGIAVERNIGVIVPTQSNRAGAGAHLLTDVHTSEDFSKIFTADTVITYSQSMAEKELGLARLFVSNTRVGDADRFVVLISQSYPVGQFCLDSAKMTNTYQSHLEALGAKPAKDDDIPPDET